MKKIALWQAHGYLVKLWFLSLPNEKIAMSRVVSRILQGGKLVNSLAIHDSVITSHQNFCKPATKAV